MHMTDSEAAAKQQELRKSRNSLMICGKALIAFGAWTALRVILYLLLGQYTLRTFIEDNIVPPETPEGFPLNLLILMIFSFVLVLCLIAFLLNFIAGRGAYREGKTGKKGTLYIVATVFLLVTTASGFIDSFRPEQKQEQTASETAAAEPAEDEGLVDYGKSDDFMEGSGSTLLDITQIAICVDILYSVYKSRSIRKELGEEQAV